LRFLSKRISREFLFLLVRIFRKRKNICNVSYYSYESFCFVTNSSLIYTFMIEEEEEEEEEEKEEAFCEFLFFHTMNAFSVVRQCSKT